VHFRRRLNLYNTLGAFFCNAATRNSVSLASLKITNKLSSMSRTQVAKACSCIPGSGPRVAWSPPAPHVLARPFHRSSGGSPLPPFCEIGFPRLRSLVRMQAKGWRRLLRWTALTHPHLADVVPPRASTWRIGRRSSRLPGSRAEESGPDRAKLRRPQGKSVRFLQPERVSSLFNGRAPALLIPRRLQRQSVSSLFLSRRSSVFVGTYRRVAIQR
jgi:hypothetical protein